MKFCPYCRHERGIADTSIILGLDDLLVYIDKVIRYVPPPPEDLPSDHE